MSTSTTVLNGKDVPPLLATLPPDAESASVNIPLSRTVASKTNRRHVRKLEADNELMESIKMRGVFQPIVVRPIIAEEEPLHRLNDSPPYTIGDQIYEVVCGHRRREMSIKAGRKTIPAVIRKLSNEEALEIQNLENLQREDLDPVDRALAVTDLYEQYLKGMSKKDAVKRIAERLNCKERSVYNMMSLSNLTAELQAALRSGDISISHGYLLGPLRPEVQKRALIDARDYQGGPFFSVRELEEWIGQEVYCLLDSTTFKKADAALVPKAGACTTCEKNSAVNPSVAPGAKSPTCTDPPCFKSKQQAHLVQIASKPKAAGAEPTKHEKQLHRALHSFADAAKRWEKLQRKGASDADLLKQIGDELAGGGGSSSLDSGWVSYKGGKKPAVWFDSMTSTGKPSLQGKALVDAVRKLLGIPLPSAKPAYEVNAAKAAAVADAAIDKHRAESEKEYQRHARKHKIEARTSAALLSTMANKAKLDNFLIQQVALTFIGDVDDPFADWDEFLGLTEYAETVLGWPAPKDKATGYVYSELENTAKLALPKMKQQKVAALLLMMVVIGQLKNPLSTRPSDPLADKVLTNLAKHYKVDVKKLRKQAAAELKAEDKAILQTSAQTAPGKAKAAKGKA